jgi:L,D-peptidoglycan transpeptidase YkuD (ErfK/YbiS/YcfS/YnhG family)
MPHANKRDLIVTALSQGARRGWLHLEGLRFPCSLGRGGLGVRKREGDGVTPIGRWPIRQIHYRGDRRGPFWRPPVAGRIATRQVQRLDGWCDAIGDRNYNRFVTHPYDASAEHLWREDQLYDVIIVLGHNDQPRVQGLGSAIFMHVAGQDDRSGFLPTAGCIALAPRDLRQVLGHVGRGTHVRVIG